MNAVTGLWRRAPRWRQTTIAASVCSVLAFLFPPTPAIAPFSSAQTQGAVPIPPIPASPSSYRPPVSAPTPAQAPPAAVRDVSLQPVAPVQAVLPTIAPSRKLDPNSLPAPRSEPQPEFGVYRGPDTSRIRPSGPAHLQRAQTTGSEHHDGQ